MNEVKIVKPIVNIGREITFGCDPELFFEKDGEIVGSEKVLTEGGKEITSEKMDSFLNTVSKYSAFVLDGVQVELNPGAQKCRQALGYEIAKAFKALHTHLSTKTDGVKACFTQTIEVSKKEFDSLSDKSKQFGCAMSHNMYDTKAKVLANPKKYRKRSAGGHIHIGLDNVPVIKQNRERLIPIMDCLVGLPSVLIDRDPNAAERRKNYGRAGEFRLPTYGIEYRTLSNYWLRSYQLFGFVMGMTRLSVSVLYTSLIENDGFHSNGWNAEGTLLAEVDMAKVVEAINTNNLELAKEQWGIVRKFIEKYVPTSGISSGSNRDYFALSKDFLKEFDFFVKKVEYYGMSYWFPQEPMEHWCQLAMMDSSSMINLNGWEKFLAKQVYDVRMKELVGG